MIITTLSEQETKRIAEKYGKQLRGGETIGLIGELGAGKTAFVKGLAKGLGIKKTITSPTFVLMKVYPVTHRTIKYFVHVDAYRVKSAKALTGIGLEDYIKAADSIVAIEWADLVQKILPKKKILIKFKHTKLGERVINFNK